MESVLAADKTGKSDENISHTHSPDINAALAIIAFNTRHGPSLVACSSRCCVQGEWVGLDEK